MTARFGLADPSPATFDRVGRDTSTRWSRSPTKAVSRFRWATINLPTASRATPDWGRRKGAGRMAATGKRKSAATSGTDTEPPTVGYWHVWADGDGVTHQDYCRFKDFSLQEFAPPTPDMWVGGLQANGSKIALLIMPPGWTGDWHRNPQPQWIVPLSGRWYVETMDGTRVEMGPGELSFGEDQASQCDDNGREGHLSGTVGDQPAVLMLIQLTDAPTVDMPCRHR